jgi:hypothetical protein
MRAAERQLDRMLPLTRHLERVTGAAYGFCSASADPAKQQRRP